MYEKIKNNLKNLNLDAELMDYDSYEIGNNTEKSTNNLHSIIEKIYKLESCKTEHSCIYYLLCNRIMQMSQCFVVAVHCVSIAKPTLFS